MRVFNPFTSRNCSQNVTTTYQCHEGQKRRTYKQCICTGKHGSFAPPLVNRRNVNGSSGDTRIVSMLAAKRDQSHSQLMNTIRCLISFSFLKLQIRCIRASSSLAGHAIRTSVNVTVSAGRIPSTYAFTMTCCLV